MAKKRKGIRRISKPVARLVDGVPSGYIGYISKTGKVMAAPMKWTGKRAKLELELTDGSNRITRVAKTFYYIKGKSIKSFKRNK